VLLRNFSGSQGRSKFIILLEAPYYPASAQIGLELFRKIWGNSKIFRCIQVAPFSLLNCAILIICNAMKKIIGILTNHLRGTGKHVRSLEIA
jgi:hypothetical protein